MGVVVTTPSATTALTTLETVKAMLDITDASQDVNLTRLITQASGIVADELGQPAGVETLTQVFHRPRHFRDQRLQPLILARRHVVAVSSVTGSSGPLEVSDYELEPSPGLLWRLVSGSWAHWHALLPVTVVYSAGWKLPGDADGAPGAPLPPAIEGVCLALVAAAYSAAGRDTALQLEVVEGVGRNGYYDRGTAATMSLDDALCAQLEPFVNYA